MTPNLERRFYNEAGKLITFDAFSPGDKKFFNIMGTLLAGLALVSFALPPEFPKFCQLPLNRELRQWCLGPTTPLETVRTQISNHFLPTVMPESVHQNEVDIPLLPLGIVGASAVTLFTFYKLRGRLHRRGSRGIVVREHRWPRQSNTQADEPSEALSMDPLSRSYVASTAAMDNTSRLLAEHTGDPADDMKRMVRGNHSHLHRLILDIADMLLRRQA